MKKNAKVWLIVSMILVSGILIFYKPVRDISFIKWSQHRVKTYPEGALDNLVVYSINPNTILTDLNHQELNVFRPSESDLAEYTPPIWPSGSFSWNEEDYLKIANALHLYYWKEPLTNWHLIHASFQIDQCKDIFDKVDSASLLFYQTQDAGYVVHGVWIDPLRGEVTVGDNLFLNTGEWKEINLSEAKVKSVDDALMIAERNGGQSARLRVKNECDVSVLFAPYVISHLFADSEWGWSILYQTNASRILFETTINPYTGK